MISTKTFILGIRENGSTQLPPFLTESTQSHWHFYILTTFLADVLGPCNTEHCNFLMEQVHITTLYEEKESKSNLLVQKDCYHHLSSQMAAFEFILFSRLQMTLTLICNSENMLQQMP
jgi:hypothetical protein